MIPQTPDSHLIADYVTKLTVHFRGHSAGRCNGSHSPGLGDADSPAPISICLTAIACLIQELRNLQIKVVIADPPYPGHCINA